MELPISNCHGVLHPRYKSLLETHLARPLRGAQRGSTTGLQGMEGTLLGGKLVLVSACLTVSPLITGGQAHTPIMFCFHAKLPASFHQDKDNSKGNNNPKNANGEGKCKGGDKDNKKKTNNKTIKNKDQIPELKMPCRRPIILCTVQEYFWHSRCCTCEEARPLRLDFQRDKVKIHHVIASMQDCWS